MLSVLLPYFCLLLRLKPAQLRSQTRSPGGLAVGSSAAGEGQLDTVGRARLATQQPRGWGRCGHQDHCLAAIQSGETAERTEAGGLHGYGQSRKSLHTRERHKSKLQTVHGTCQSGQVDGRLRWVCGPGGSAA